MPYTIGFYRSQTDFTYIHNPAQGLYVLSATVSKEHNSADSLVFEVDATNPIFEELFNMVMRPYNVEVEEVDQAIIFNGRILSVEYDRLGATARVTCESFLAVLNDFVLEPYDYSGVPRNLLAGYLEMAMEIQPDSDYSLVLGNVTVTDPNDYIVRGSESHVSAWDEVSAKTFGSSLGGYLWAEHGGYDQYGKTIVKFSWTAEPYLDEITTPQVVAFKNNMLTCDDEFNGSDIVTGIYPTGAELEESSTRSWVELDNESSTTGDVIRKGKCVYSKKLVERYGRYLRHVSFPNVTIKNNLLRTAVKYLNDLSGVVRSMNCRAIDMVDAGKAAVRFQLGQLTTITYPVDDGQASYNLILTKMSIDLLDPSNSDFQFGKIKKSSSESGSSSGGGEYNADENHSHAEGYMCETSGYASHAKGIYTLASGIASDASGGYESPLQPSDSEYYSVASGAVSHAEGGFTHAKGDYSHAEGFGYTDNAYEYGIYCNRADGKGSHAEGCYSVASGDGAHAEGCGIETTGVIGVRAQRAAGIGAHAEGRATHAEYEASHAEGKRTSTGNSCQHVAGKYNKVRNNHALVIGNGADDSNRSNALELDWSGNLLVSGGMCPALIQATGSSTVSLSANTPTKIPLTTTSILSGNWFTLFNGGVRCNFDGAVKITASAYITANEGSTRKSVHVLKGPDAATVFANTSDYEVLSAADAKASAQNFSTVPTASKIVEVASGDILFLAARSVGASGSCDGTNPGTYLLVERVY